MVKENLSALRYSVTTTKVGSMVRKLCLQDATVLESI